MRIVLRAPGRFVAVDEEAPAYQLGQEFLLGRCPLGALARLAEELGQQFGIGRCGFGADGCGAYPRIAGLLAAGEQLEVALDGFGGRQLGIDAAGAGVGRGDHARRRLLERDGDASGPDRGVEPGLPEGVGFGVEQLLFLVPAVLEAAFLRVEVAGCLFEMLQRIARDAEVAGKIAQIGRCRGAAPESPGLAVFIEVVDGAYALGLVEQDVGL
ncbi:MAG: hypothetical protein NTX37_04665 [Burkholderiales bacterium]|nr:hypothetical protein [Burkholderiales bacterium]